MMLWFSEAANQPVQATHWLPRPKKNEERQLLAQPGWWNRNSPNDCGCRDNNKATLHIIVALCRTHTGTLSLRCCLDSRVATQLLLRLLVHPGPRVQKIVVVDETKTSINGRFACKITGPDIVWCFFFFLGCFSATIFWTSQLPTLLRVKCIKGNLTNLVVIPDRQQNKRTKTFFSFSQIYFFGVKQSVCQQLNYDTCTRPLVQFIFPSTNRAFKNLQTSQGPAQGKNMFLHHNAFNRIVHFSFDFWQTP